MSRSATPSMPPNAGWRTTCESCALRRPRAGRHGATVGQPATVRRREIGVKRSREEEYARRCITREGCMIVAPSMLSTKPIPPEERLILALDLPGPEAAWQMVQLLGPRVQFYKLGLELFMAGGCFELMAALRDRGKRVFVDLKFFDVPQTVSSAVRQLARRGADFATVHGNDAILEAACAVKEDLRILAVTVLTSLDEGDMRALGFETDIHSLVLSRARRALAVGCDGVVSSGLEASGP